MSGGSDRKTAGKVGVISLGCPKNLVDTEIMLGELRKQGHTVVSELDEAETVIVNTCGFIDEAKSESIDAILEVAERKGHGVKRLLVAGCMVNRHGQEMEQEIPEIDGFIGLDDLQNVDRLVQLGNTAPEPGPAHAVFDHRAPRLLTTRGYAYLKVAEGCDNPCTFCAIPHWRGRFRSRSVDSLVREAIALEAEGAQELCLIAQDTTRYGEDVGMGRRGLERLVEELLQRTTIPWIRFLYAYPTTLNDHLLKLMAAEERFVSYVDMPLQHSHPQILRAMQRGGSGEQYLRQIERIRELVPDIYLRSTFIVGFPGERHEHWRHLQGFLESAVLDHVGAFVYSPEERTPAAELAGRIPRAAGERRKAELLELQRPISLRRRNRLVGQRVPVLVEGVCDETEHLLQGRHYGQAPEIDGRVLINDGFAEAGTFAEVEITEAHPDDIVGHIVTPAEVGKGS